MQTHEHTPQPAETLRETAGNPTPQKEHPAQIEMTMHKVEMHVETVPGPHSYYEKSDEAHDINENSSLYWGVATF